jgi:hypothetical protein
LGGRYPAPLSVVGTNGRDGVVAILLDQVSQEHREDCLPTAINDGTDAEEDFEPSGGQVKRVFM